MTAGVTSAIAASFTPAASPASRLAEASSGNFGEALDKTSARDAGQKAVRKTESNMHRWHQHGTADVSDDVSALKQENSEDKLEGIEPEVAGDLAEDAAAPEESGNDGTVDDGSEAASLPAQMKAEHAISAMMALAPRAPSGDRVKQHNSDESTAEQADAPQSPEASRAAGQSTTASMNRKADATDTGAQAAPASVAADSLAGGTQTDGTDSEQNHRAGKTMPDAAGIAKPVGADGTSSQAATQDRSATTEPQALPAGGDSGGGQSNASTRDQRDDAPEARRTELQSATVKVSVVSQQAVPAPAAPPALGVNVAAIVSAIDSFQNLRPLANSSALLPQNAQPIQSLKIQLHPAELGTVTANLKATGGRLSVELHVENHEAYRRLSIDSDSIVKSLQALGYDIDRVSIQQPQAVTTGVARSDASAGAGSFSRDTSSSQSGNSGGGGERLGGQASERGDRGDAQGNDRIQPNYQDRASGSLYI